MSIAPWSACICDFEHLQRDETSHWTPPSGPTGVQMVNSVHTTSTYHLSGLGDLVPSQTLNS